MANYDPRNWREEYDELRCFIADLMDDLEGTDGAALLDHLAERYALQEKHNVEYFALGYRPAGGVVENFRRYRAKEGSPIPANEIKRRTEEGTDG